MRIAPEGWVVIAPIAAGCALAPAAASLAGAGMAVTLPLAGLGVGLLAFTLWFFRDPVRLGPAGAGPHAVISPADGRVIKIDEAALPAELAEAGREVLGTAAGERLVRVAIFLNLLNVHVNCAPVSGRVAAVSYRRGKFFNASLDKASEHNERSAALVVTPGGSRVAFVQIAGLVAYRIINYLKPGQEVARGERFGMIRFGSRAEVYLPRGSRVSVRVGERVTAGVTVLGEIAS